MGLMARNGQTSVGPVNRPGKLTLSTKVRTNGANAANNTTNTVANIAFRSLRLSVDTKTPEASDRKIVFNSTSADCHKSVAVTPPSWTGSDITGRIATSA